jgi:hypothetical protein
MAKNLKKSDNAVIKTKFDNLLRANIKLVEIEKDAKYAKLLLKNVDEEVIERMQDDFASIKESLVQSNEYAGVVSIQGNDYGIIKIENSQEVVNKDNEVVTISPRIKLARISANVVIDW